MKSQLITTIIILLFIGLAAPQPCTATSHTPAIDQDLLVACAFIIGEIQNPSHHHDFSFHVARVTIIGFFWEDLGIAYFNTYHLNESWFARDVDYWGINQLRILKNQSEITHICGIITGSFFGGDD